jgi:ankyrin repeat protein
MVSKTKLNSLVREFRWKETDEALAENPALISVRDERGRNWLHLCCGVNLKGGKLKASDSIKTAEVLLRRGLDINGEAFTEGAWKATPLWYAIARGQNLALADYLLKHGSTPNYSLWAAAFNNDLDAIRLLIRHGANLNDAFENETPFLSAIKTSHFRSAEELLKLGSDVNYQDSKGMTALHYMLKKDSDKKHFAMLIAHRARGDIRNRDGITAAEIMRKKKDPDFRKMADQLR